MSDGSPAPTGPPFLDKATMKRLLLARSYGMSDEMIAEQFGWTVDELLGDHLVAGLRQHRDNGAEGDRQ